MKGCLSLFCRVLDRITRVELHARVLAAKSLLSVLCTPYVRPFPFHLIPAGCHDLSSNLHFTASLNTHYKAGKTPSRTHKIVLKTPWQQKLIMLLQSAHFPGQQLHLAAAVIIIVLAWRKKRKQNKQAESISAISEMFFATIIGIAG